MEPEPEPDEHTEPEPGAASRWTGPSASLQDETAAQKSLEAALEQEALEAAVMAASSSISRPPALLERDLQELSGLGIYCNPSEEPLPDLGSDSWMAAMRNYAPTSYVLKPLAGQVHVTLDKSGGQEPSFSHKLEVIATVLGRCELVLEHEALSALAAVGVWAQNVVDKVPPQTPVAESNAEQEYSALFGKHCGARLEYSGFEGLQNSESEYLTDIEDQQPLLRILTWRRKALQQLSLQVQQLHAGQDHSLFGRLKSKMTRSPGRLTT